MYDTTASLAIFIFFVAKAPRPIITKAEDKLTAIVEAVDDSLDKRMKGDVCYSYAMSIKIVSSTVLGAAGFLGIGGCRRGLRFGWTERLGEAKRSVRRFMGLKRQECLQ